jgi:hypothetical protein
MPTSHTTSSDDRRRRGGSSKKKNRGGGSAAYAPATVTVDQMPHPPPPPPPRRNGKQAEVMPTDEQLWPVGNIKPSVREWCGNMQGSELIRELLRNGLNISSGDDYQLSLDKHLKELVEYSARFPFPGPPVVDSSEGATLNEPIPVLMVSAFATHTLDTKTKKTKAGKIILSGPVTFDALGALFTQLATLTIYPDKDTARKFLQNPASLLDSINANPYLVDIIRMTDSYEITKISFLMKNVVPEGLAKVRVGASAIHGNGVFAEHQIDVGDLITMYPCDVLALDNPNGGMRFYRADGKDLLRTEANMYVAYLCKVEGTRMAIAGDPDKHCPAACAHIINDGAYIDKHDFGLDEAMRYTEKSYHMQNCHFVSLADCCMVAIATKVIQKDQEVLAGYGAEFWGHIAKRGMV